MDEQLVVAFARFEEGQREHERARAIYRYSLDRMPKDQCEQIYRHYCIHEKKYGDRQGIEDVIVGKRKFKYEEEVKENAFNYDAWFDYLRLMESDGNEEQTRDVYERAIANVPPSKEKRHWRRYIYLWINYAIYEELDAADLDRARQVYRACLDLVPHKRFTFAKVWLMFAQFELRQKNLSQARKILGTAVGKCPKEKLFREYIELEIQLREFERCRILYEKFLAFSPENCTVWMKFSELETILGDVNRARAIFELAICQPRLDMPEVLWKAYIDFEIEEERYDNARKLYRQLLQRTQHVKVWISFAQLELSITEEEDAGGSEVARSREVYRQANRALKTAQDKEERLMLLENWKQFEHEHGDTSSQSALDKLMPNKVKKRRKVQTEDGTDAGWEEYYDYIFPDDMAAKPNLKLLAMAKNWKQKMEQGSDEAVDSEKEIDEAETHHSEGAIENGTEDVERKETGDNDDEDDKMEKSADEKQDTVGMQDTEETKIDMIGDTERASDVGDGDAKKESVNETTVAEHSETVAPSSMINDAENGDPSLTEDNAEEISEDDDDQTETVKLDIVSKAEQSTECPTKRDAKESTEVEGSPSESKVMSSNKEEEAETADSTTISDIQDGTNGKETEEEKKMATSIIIKEKQKPEEKGSSSSSSSSSDSSDNDEKQAKRPIVANKRITRTRPSKSESNSSSSDSEDDKEKKNKKSQRKPSTSSDSSDDKKGNSNHDNSGRMEQRKLSPHDMKNNRESAISKRKENRSSSSGSSSEDQKRSPRRRSQRASPPRRDVGNRSEFSSRRPVRENSPSRSRRESPPRRPGRDSPSRRPGRESPSRRSRRESPPRRPRRESPSRRSGRESPSRRSRRESPPRRPRRESPSSRTGRESPPRRSMRESPSRRPERESPSRRARRESPPRRDKRGSSPKQGRRESPSRRGHQESPSMRNRQASSPKKTPPRSYHKGVSPPRVRRESPKRERRASPVKGDDKREIAARSPEDIDRHRPTESRTAKTRDDSEGSHQSRSPSNRDVEKRPERSTKQHDSPERKAASTKGRVSSSSDDSDDNQKRPPKEASSGSESDSSDTNSSDSDSSGSDSDHKTKTKSKH